MGGSILLSTDLILKICPLLNYISLYQSLFCVVKCCFLATNPLIDEKVIYKPKILRLPLSSKYKPIKKEKLSIVRQARESCYSKVENMIQPRKEVEEWHKKCLIQTYIIPESQKT